MPGFPGFGGPSRPAPAPAPRGNGGWFGGDFFAPFQQQAPQAPRQDFSRAPAPAKRDTVPEHNVLVLGDAMADWLAYGLEEAYAEQPDAIVVMLGLNDRVALREPAADKSADKKGDKKDDKKDARAKPGDAKP